MKLAHINLKLFSVWFALCISGGAFLAWLSEMPFWGSAAIVAAALVINGVVAETEDRAPGGFFNPRGQFK